MHAHLFACSMLIFTFSSLSIALNPNCAPGGNFDLASWILQLPTGSAGAPNEIHSSQLQGCSGYQDSGHQYFFTDSGDGAVVMKVPGSPASSGCVTTGGSLHCRTELREANPSTGARASWLPSSVHNRLSVSLAVPIPDDGSHGTVIGQIISAKPVFQLHYDTSGDVVMSGGGSITKIGNIAVGKTFSYEIRYESNVLSISLNGGAQQELGTHEFDSSPCYFKVGNYNQGNSPSEAHFYSIHVEH